MILAPRPATRYGWRDGLLPAPVVIGLLASAPFLLPGFPAARDSLSHLFRVWALHTAILGGDLYPRWFDAFVYGYGYPLLNFYGPLLYYLAELPRLAGIETIAALRLAVAFSEVLAALGAYLLARDLFGRGGGLLAAACYVATPYVQTDLLVRGAFPEVLGIALAPFALWALGRSGARWVIVGGLATALLILAHNAAALIELPIIAAYGAWLALAFAQPRRLVATALTLLLGLALTAFFWLPAVVELNAVWLGGPEGATTFLQSLAIPAALVQKTLIHDYTETPGAFLPAGLVQVLLALVGLPFAVRRREGWFFGLLLVTSLALMMASAAPVWQRLPLATLMAFPWRLQAATALATAILAGGAAGMLGALPRLRLLGWLGVGVLTLTALAAGLGGLRPEFLDITPADIGPGGFARFDRWSGFIGTTSPVQFRPRAVQVDPATLPLPAPPETSPQAPPVVTGMTESGSRLTISVHADTVATLRLRTFAFPGWTAEIDGVTHAVQPDGPAGIVSVPIPAGEHQVTVWFGATPVRQTGLVLSVLGALALGGIVLVRLRALTVQRGQPALQRAAAAALVPVALLGWRILQPPPQTTFVPNAETVGPMRLLGYRADTTRVSDNGWLNVQATWQVLQPLGEGWQAVAALQDSGGARIATTAALPNYGTVSPARWAAGDLVDDTQGINLPPGQNPGMYHLLLGWRAPDGTEALADAGDLRVPGTAPAPLPAGVLSANVAFEGGIRLIGARAKPALALPLGLILPLPKLNVPPALEITLVWQTNQIQRENLSTFIHFNRGNDTLAQTLSFPPLDQRYTTGWPVDRPVVQRFRLDLPDVPPGGYDVVAGLFRRPSLERLKTVQGDDTALIDRFRRQAPLPGTRLDASFQAVTLVGYDRVDSCGGTIRPPCTLTMRLVWRGDDSTIEPLTAFVHVIGPDGTIIAQSDGPIAEGADPTESWQQGDLVEETRSVPLPTNAAPGDYQVVAGLYRPGDLSRLPVAGGDSLPLFKISVAR